MKNKVLNKASFLKLILIFFFERLNNSQAIVCIFVKLCFVLNSGSWFGIKTFMK